jgi:integrase
MPKRGPRGGGTVHWKESKGCWVWRAVVGVKPDGSSRYREGRARTQAEALRRKREAEQSGRQPDPGGLRVGDYLDRWLADSARPNVRPQTWERYEQIVRLYLKPHLGGVRLLDLRSRDVTRFYAELHRGGSSPGQVRKVAEVLATAMEQAAREGVLPAAPTRHARKPRVDSPPIEVFTDDEVKAVLTAAAGRRLYALFAVAVGSGARLGELLALEWEDYDPAARTLRIRRKLSVVRGRRATVGPPKSARGVRTIALPAFAADALEAHAPPDRRAGVVFSTRPGGYLSRSSFRSQVYGPVLEAAGVRYRKFHTFRHTHASRLLAEGVDVAEVARRLGDTPATVLKVYAHWVHRPDRGTAEKVDAMYRRPPV